MEYQVTILGHDVTNWIREKPTLPYRKNEIGALVEVPNVELIGDNTRQVWTPDHPNSLLVGNWEAGPVEIYTDDILLYKGKLRNTRISNAGNTANIATTARINEILGSVIPFFSQDIKTMAELSQDIYEQYGVETDPVTYQRAKEKQEYWLLQANASINIMHQMTVLQAQQWLANAGNCRHYFIGDTAYMEYDDPDETRYSMYTFTDEHIFDFPDYSLVEKQIYDGYEVLTVTGTAYKFGLNKVPTLDAGNTRPFRFLTPETGYNWGDIQIANSKRKQYKAQVHFTRGAYTSWINLQSIITLQSDRYGINQDFQLIGIDHASDLGPVVEVLSL